MGRSMIFTQEMGFSCPLFLISYTLAMHSSSYLSQFFFYRAFKRILCCSRSSSNQSSIAARIINGESSSSSTFERCNVIRIFSSKHRKKSPFRNTLVSNQGTRPVQDTSKKYLDTDPFKILSEKSI